MVVDFVYDEDFDIEASKNVSSFVKTYIELPKEGTSLYGKFIALCDGTRRPYLPAPFHEYMAGDDPKTDSRRHFCIKGANPAAKCPECEAFWAAVKKRKELKDNGDTSSSEYKRAEMEAKMYRQKTGGLLLFVPKGGKKITPLFVKETFLDKAFGRKPIPALNKGAIVGFVNELKAEGVNPFSVKDAGGWLRLWKTGTGLETEFNISLDTESVKALIDGRQETVTKKVYLEMEPEIIDILRAGKTPDLVAVLSANDREWWTYEESEDYVNNGVIPERCRKRVKSVTASASVPSAKKGSKEDDIGFYDDEVEIAPKTNKKASVVEEEDDLPF